VFKGQKYPNLDTLGKTKTGASLSQWSGAHCRTFFLRRYPNSTDKIIYDQTLNKISKISKTRKTSKIGNIRKIGKLGKISVLVVVTVTVTVLISNSIPNSISITG
jgi:hypothetical protein